MSLASTLGQGRKGLLAMLDRARRNRYLFAAVTGNLAIWSMTALTVTVMPKTYQIEWSMIVPSSDPDARSDMANVGQAYANNRSNYDSKSLDPRVNYRAVLTSKTVLEAAAKKVELKVEQFGVPKIKLVDQSSIMELVTNGSSPEQAEAKALALYSAFEQRVDALRVDEGNARERGIEASIKTSRDKLDAAQSTLVEFKVASQVVSTRQLEDAVGRIGALQGKQLELSAQVSRYAGQIARLATSLHMSSEDAGRIIVLQADAEFAALLNKNAAGASELAEYSSRWDTGHTKVSSALGRQQGTSQAMERRAKQLLGVELSSQKLRDLALVGGERGQEPLIRELVAINAQHAAAQAELRSVSAEYESARKLLDSLARKSSQLDDLERRLKFSEAVFNSALVKTDVGRSNIFSSYPLIQLLEGPRTPQRSDKRPVLMALVGAMACSILLSVALTLAWLRKKEASV